MRTRTLASGRIITTRQNGGIRKRCGCPRSVWTKPERCAHPYHANYSHNGREYRVSLHKWAKKPAGYVMLKGEAQTLFRQWQDTIENGGAVAAPSKAETFDTLADRYLSSHVAHPDRRASAQREMRRQVQVLRSVFGGHAAEGITKAMIEAFREDRRRGFDDARDAGARVANLRANGESIPVALQEAARRAVISTKAGRVATNRLISRLRHIYVWAIEHDLIATSPFTKAGVSVIKLDHKAEAGRTRRLEGDEESRLLAAAGPHLRACIEATLETGMRRGEVLGLQWHHVRLSLGVIELPATVTKTGLPRTVVVSSRLAAILEMRRTAPDGRLHPPTAYVFGDECGGRIRSIKTAWRGTCQRAGITGLTFHDLRREAGSRLLEAPGVSLTDVRDFLGHRDVNQTNTYLATTAQRLRAAIEKRDLARTNLAHGPVPLDSTPEPTAVTH